jgi:eukaryotic-like serine/threonine-protein kinase
MNQGVMTMFIRRLSRSFFVSLGLLLLLAACSSTAGTPGVTPTRGTTPTPVVTTTTAPVPPTPAGCPPSGTARAAVMATLALGKHPSIVYVYNQASGNTPTYGFLKRDDVTTGSKAVIVQVPGFIAQAQLSADGQWVLFTSAPSYNTSPEKLQLVRVDGQGLQTLYCGATTAQKPQWSTAQNPQWSTNQRYIAFTTLNNGQERLQLLNVTNGTLQTLLSSSMKSQVDQFFLRTWLDNTHLYLVNFQPDQPSNKVYVLDITKGQNQQITGLTTVVSQEFNDFDSSYDGTHLYVNYGLCGMAGCFPPGLIVMKPALGGQETPILNSPKYDTMSVRVATANTLLVMIRNDQTAVPNADTSHNGLWKMHADGTGLARLTTDSAHQRGALNDSSQYPWSNASRDGSMYALEQGGSQGTTQVSSLLFGPLSGGTPTPFASITGSSSLAIVGWTTF